MVSDVVFDYDLPFTIRGNLTEPIQIRFAIVFLVIRIDVTRVYRVYRV